MKDPIVFNFDKIHSLQSFYSACKPNLQLPDHFGNNLDALWDCIIGQIELPVDINFTNLTAWHLKKFEKQIELMLDAEKELDGDLSFECFTKDESDAG